MNKKVIMPIILVVVLLVIGYIVYRGFFAGKGGDQVLDVTTQETPAVAPILSNGHDLDFTQIKKYNSQEQLFNYPKTSSDDLNLPLPDLIK